MEYGNFLTEISNTSDDNSQPEEIFLFPLALYLDHKSVVSTYNRVTKKPKMKFRVEMCKSKRKLKYLKVHLCVFVLTTSSSGRGSVAGHWEFTYTE
jgi:hypothetical protein